VRAALGLTLLAVFAASGCSGDEKAGALPQGSEPVQLDPADFVDRIDNPYWPMSPGSRWIYRETGADGAEQRVVVTVTGRTKQILGIDAVVVHDVVTEDGAVKEDTLDWYAQDADGNVWYLGEQTAEYENGKVVSTEGSWEAGVGGAQAGLIMPAEPRAGLSYRQEYLEGEAEDAAEVLGVDEAIEVPFGRFDHVLLTKDFTPLDPDALEHKFYARGVGPALVIALTGGGGREELVSFRRGGKGG
jgi:hypothetical protein